MRMTGLIKTVKEQLRQVPDKGLGYGVLKYINREEELQGRECWDVVFNYLGQLDNVVRESKWFKGASEGSGAGRSEELTVREKLSVNAMVQSGQLILNWTYSNKHFSEERVKELARSYVTHLGELIEHCLEQQQNSRSSIYPIGLWIRTER